MFNSNTEKYCRLKEIVRLMKSQNSDIKGNKLTEDCKMIGNDERIKQNRNSNHNNNIKWVFVALMAHSLRLQ